MSADSFVLGGFEAYARQAGVWNALPPPFELQGVRADAWGIRPDDSLVAFAEAKTLKDIDTPHTRSQFRILGFTRMRRSKRYCPLYIAVPRSGASPLDRVLNEIGLLRAPHIVRLHVPGVLLEEPVRGPKSARA